MAAARRSDRRLAVPEHVVLVPSYRGAAAICGTTHKTVERIIDLHQAGGVLVERTPSCPRAL